jgi:hypothetical protein
MASKVAFYTATTAQDVDAKITAIEAEADIATATIVGYPGETATDALVSGEVLTYPEMYVYRVTTGTVASEAAANTALSDMVTAVGGIEAAGGYTSVYTA